MNEAVMHSIGNELVNELSKSLGESFKSGDLLNSISYKIKDGKIQIFMLPYWKYVEYGTPGTKQGQSSTAGGKTVSFGPNTQRKMPVKKEGDDWINLLTDQKGDWALAKHIQLYGTKPYPFVRPVLYHKLKDIARRSIKRHVQ